MMRESRSLMSMLIPVFAAALLAGCTPPEPKPEPVKPIMQATPQQAADIMAAIAKEYPGSHVGHVSMTKTENNTAAVAGIPIGDVHLKDSVQFIDSNQVTIANGTVISSNTDHPDYMFLIVEYTPTPTGRAPVKGDLVVYLPPK